LGYEILNYTAITFLGVAKKISLKIK